MQISITINGFCSLFWIFVVTHESVSTSIAYFTYVITKIPSSSSGFYFDMIISVPGRFLPTSLNPYRVPNISRDDSSVIFCGPVLSLIPYPFIRKKLRERKYFLIVGSRGAAPYKKYKH